MDVAVRRVGPGTIPALPDGTAFAIREDGCIALGVPGTACFLGYDVKHELINESAQDDLVMLWVITPPGLELERIAPSSAPPAADSSTYTSIRNSLWARLVHAIDLYARGVSRRITSMTASSSSRPRRRPPRGCSTARRRGPGRSR